ncbi:MAG: membrane associated rhomboid family serine protease [Limisphaerales bacterium]|jgi:membrane associated rhomboid family serine protease
MELSINWVIIGITALTSYMAFQNSKLKYNCLLIPSLMKAEGQWHRFITHGFVHADFNHVFLNLFVLYSFGSLMETVFGSEFNQFGSLYYILLYFGGMLAASLPIYFKQKNNPSYTSLGASGAVAAVLFSYILFFPMSSVYLFFAIKVNSALFGVLYLAYSTYMNKRGGDNVAHDAHFYGAIFGFTFPILLKPALLTAFIAQIKDLLG